MVDVNTNEDTYGIIAALYVELAVLQQHSKSLSKHSIKKVLCIARSQVEELHEKDILPAGILSEGIMDTPKERFMGVPTFSLLGMWYHYDGVLNLSGQHYVPTTQCEDCSPTLGGTLKETFLCSIISTHQVILVNNFFVLQLE